MTETRHMYCGDSKTLDFEKMRREAEIGSKGDYRTAPQNVIIHMHLYVEPCLKTFKHLEFPAQEEE